MPFDIDPDYQALLEQTQRPEIVLCFLTITDPNAVDPIRIVCEENKGISFANALPINYYLDGDLFSALPFSFSRVSDNDQPARAVLNVPAFSSEIGNWLRTMADPARLRMQLYLESDWSPAIGVGNSRSPSGTPELLYDANHLWLRSGRGGMTVITADLGGYDFTREPLGKRVTKDLCPDIFR